PVFDSTDLSSLSEEQQQQLQQLQQQQSTVAELPPGKNPKATFFRDRNFSCGQQANKQARFTAQLLAGRNGANASGGAGARPHPIRMTLSLDRNSIFAMDPAL